jgi:hypothetical protein
MTRWCGGADGTLRIEPDTENVDRPIHSGWLRQKHDLWILSYSTRVWCVLTGRGDLEMYREGKMQPYMTVRLHTAADIKADPSGLKNNELKVKYSVIANRLKDASELNVVRDALGNIRYAGEKLCVSLCLCRITYSLCLCFPLARHLCFRPLVISAPALSSSLLPPSRHLCLARTLHPDHLCFPRSLAHKV